MSWPGTTGLNSMFHWTKTSRKAKSMLLLTHWNGWMVNLKFEFVTNLHFAVNFAYSTKFRIKQLAIQHFGVQTSIWSFAKSWSYQFRTPPSQLLYFVDFDLSFLSYWPKVNRTATEAPSDKKRPIALYKSKWKIHASLR